MGGRRCLGRVFVVVPDADPRCSWWPGAEARAGLQLAGGGRTQFITNNQASWICDGWSYEPGFVERSYQSCHQNPKGATQTWDECWSPNNTLTLSLAGSTTTLVPDNSAKDVYHP